MPNPETCVAIVTARGGSKRIPGKNIRPLLGKPLIGWTVEAALAAFTIDRVIVSTDDAAIAQAGLDAGAEVPFMRPAELAGDRSSHYDVIAHALDWLEDEGGLPDQVCLLQPTSPLRIAEDIDATVDLVRSSGADSAFSVSLAPIHPQYMHRLDSQARAEPYLPRTEEYVRSQDLEPLYHVNGAVYVLRPATFRLRNTVLSDRPLAHVMPRDRAIDIDEEIDFALAEALFRLRFA